MTCTVDAGDINDAGDLDNDGNDDAELLEDEKISDVLP